MVMQTGQGMKPTWRGLKSGGQRTPLKEVVGVLQQWGIGQDGFNNAEVQLHLVRMQVLQTDTPHPYAEGDIPIKYSDKDNSAWAKFGHSVANVLGIHIDDLDIDALVNQTLHLFRHDNVSFGKNRTTGEDVKGSYWELVEILAPGQQPKAMPGVAAPVAAVATATANPVAANPAPAAAPTALPAAPVAGETAEQQALRLLHGKSLADFFKEALPSELIRSDQALTNGILTNTWIQAKLSSGEVTQDEAGIYHVVGM